MERIDNNPTTTYKGYDLREGNALPFGATIVPGGINFSIYSQHAKSCTLVIYKRGELEPFIEIPFPESFKIGNVFCMIVYGLDYEKIEYGYRMDGEFAPKRGYWFDEANILLDPYAKSISGRDEWGQPVNLLNKYQHRARITRFDYDWRGDKHLEIPMEELVIYEMHVRGFTNHESSNVKYKGTYSGIREKIPYLKELGVNCVELMPITSFDEFENSRESPITGEKLLNYWGYSSIGFFAPKAGYAKTGKVNGECDEFKTLIRDLHKHGIEVILDVVYNHTGEGNGLGPCISFRGIDNKTYYMLTSNGEYYNFSGCGNTLNCNHPVVRDLILSNLRNWVAEYHIDGFRFDLASILGRNQDGTPMSNPPLLESLAFDPILGKCKLIAEAWDAGGLYQVGSFPSWGRFAEWNGKFRDDVRRFLKGDEGTVMPVIQRIMGSPDLYFHKGLGTCSSINFVTCHDGFTLMDLFSYNTKHNWANCENNRDGSDNNYSWNCGVEGQTDNYKINSLRKKLIKNAISILMISQGIPMIYMGDEFGNSQYGNNNAYCQDNEVSWLDWNDLNTNNDIFNFMKNMIEFRKTHSVLRNKLHWEDEVEDKAGYSHISWHGVKQNAPDKSHWSRSIALMLWGKSKFCDNINNDHIYIILNMYWENQVFELPNLNLNERWHLFVDTGKPVGKEICSVGNEILLKNQSSYTIEGRSVVILVAKQIQK